MAFKDEERKSESFRLQGASEAERDKKESEGTDDAPKELLIAQKHFQTILDGF